MYIYIYKYIYIYIYGHVYFVLHQKRSIPRKGFEIGFCKEGWHDFPWRRPFRGSTERLLCCRNRDL